MKYIQNVHNAPITASARDERGRVVFSKTFLPARADEYTGRVEATGFTQLTDEEYEALVKTSRVLAVYRDKHKLLVEHSELPPEAKTPHEALTDARKEARKAATVIEALKAENTKLKADLLDAQTAYRTLESASTDEEKLKPLTDKIASLEKDKEAMRESIDRLTEERDALRAGIEKSAKAGGKKKAAEFE